VSNDVAINVGTSKKRPVLKFMISLAAAIGMVFLLRQPGFTDSQVYTIFLLFFAISLWITEAIPPFAVSLFIIAFLVFAMGNPHFNSAPEKIDPYVNTFSSSVIWLMLGGFFLALAMKKTKLDEQFFQFAVRISGTNPRRLLFGLMMTTMFTSMLMSSAAATAMVIAAITPMITSLGKKSGVTKAFLLGVPLSAMIGGMGTIIGTSPNAIAVGALENIGIKISFLDWMKYGVPVAIVLVTVSCLVFILVFLKDKTPIHKDLITIQKTEQTGEMKAKRRIVIVVLAVTILLWLLSTYLEITVASVTALPLVVLTLTGVISSNDVRTLPWDTLLLVAGGLSLGVALQHTDLLAIYSAKIVQLGLNPIMLLFVFAFLAMAIANFMSASAIVMVLIPLAFAILPALKKEVAIILALVTSSGMFLPVSDIPTAIAYSTGMLEQKDFRIGGTVTGILGPLLIILWVTFIA
jgi:solute carrier family 13 (sodium-dependent dicarboxylate transporter), member 2/3/5